MPSPIIRTENLGRAFPMGRETIQAIRNIDLEIEPGAFLAILGPSGSGKSTLLYLLGGLDRPTEGSVRVDGEDLRLMDENSLARYRRSHIGFVFQSFNLLSTMTAAENVAFPMRFARVPADLRASRARELLNRVGLSDRASHRPTELSGGQQQRVAIARAMANDPEIILADEPTGNLDTTSGAQILHLLDELHGQGRTVLVVSHDARVSQYATHTLHLLDGRIVDPSEYEAALAIASRRGL
jgi:putative ABC transport system ATP-binding protein